MTEITFLATAFLAGAIVVIMFYLRKKIKISQNESSQKSNGDKSQNNHYFFTSLSKS